LSRLLNGQVVPRAETLKSLAAALELDEADLLHLAGYLDEIPTDYLDPSAAQLAKQLTDLPPHVRELAIRAMGTTLEAIYASARV
jgi:transcriptional regulator with XRE-family HTH domain